MGPANDEKVEDEYEQSPDFCTFALPDAAFLVLTSIKAALFTAIVTAFVLDAMSYLDENTTTKLLRIIAEQSATNSTIELPSSSPPPSILTVSTLWFLSIISSLAATTWAMLCLEWCAFYTDGVPPEDYEEMAEKRQRKYEAVERWRMHLVVAAIPFFLHLSLFLFLAGLWLRLRDVNKQLGLIVGVPSLIIATSYVVVTLLPIFTDAPFSTSASELLQPIFDGIKRIAELGRFIHPPRVFSRLKINRLIIFPEWIYEMVKLFLGNLWKAIALVFPIVRTFWLYKNPLDELNKLKVGRSGQDRGVHLRALLWLVNTPLSQDEVKGILEEFKARNRGSAGKPLDRTIIKLFVLSLSSILEDNRITHDEQPIFDHCTTALAEEMDRAFMDGEHNSRILLRNTAISEKLSPHFHLTAFDEDALSRHSMAGQGDDYWKRAIPALWLCPSTETLRSVVNRLDLDIQLIEAPRLQHIVRGIHAATLACFNTNQSTLELIPDFSLWHWDFTSSDQEVDAALSGFLETLFAEFHNTLARCDNPTCTPELVVDCLKALDDQSDRYTLKLHSALCFFIAVLQRSDPKVFEEGPSVARALLDSAESYRGEGGPVHAKLLATRLRAIAYGPKPLISSESRALTRLGHLYAGLPNSTKTNEQCMERFIDANAGILEATLPVDGHFTVFAWERSPDCKTALDIWTDTLFTHDAPFSFVRQHPNHRLPYLYSLAIALSYTTEERRQGLWRVADLLVTRGEQEGVTVDVDRALDTNILVVAVLSCSLYNQSDAAEQERFLRLLQNTVIGGTDWRTRWKSIYLIADLACLLSRMNAQFLEDERTKFLIDAANNSSEEEKLGCVPSDWERKRKGLALCKLEMKDLVSARDEAKKGVYKWIDREDVPYLSLYNPRRAPTEPISDAAYWVTTMLRR